MMQQLYVDGHLVDINENTEVTLNFKSNLLTGAGEFVGNSSQTITLPSTVRNRNIFGHADVVQGGGTVPYVFHAVDYFRNGVQIISGGIGRLISMKDDEIQVAITWGIRSAIDAMLTTDDTLNDISTNAAIEFHALPQVSTYTEATQNDVFYATIDTLKYPGENTYYRLHVGVAGRQWDTSDIANTPSSYLHPSVGVAWIIQQLTTKYGVSFDYSWVFDYVDELIVPLISKVPNEITYNGGYKATCTEPASWGGLAGNFIRFTTTQSSVIIDSQTTPPEGALVCGTAFKGVGRFSIYLYIDNLVQVSYPIFKAGFGYAIDVTIAGRTQRCTLLPEDYYIMADEINAGRVGITATGYFPVEMLTGEQLTIRLSAIKNGVVDTDLAGNIHVYGGNLWINDIIGSENEVQPTQQYPVSGNLPEIKPIDLIKFLCAITGIFPTQNSTNETIFFFPVNELFNYSNAVDWSGKLLSETDRPVAEESGYTLEGWCRRNWWRWKQDETVYGDYDGSIDIDNETISDSRDIMTMPFAATDGNNIPMYTTERKWDEDAQDWFYSTKWSKVEPRVLRLFKDANDNAGATFEGLEMETIINNRYGYLQKTLLHPVVIKERVELSDIELAELDETKPIYLQQHGAHFALLELTLKGDGIAEVTLLKLKKED